MNLLKQIAIQLGGSALGLLILIVTKVSYHVWLPAFTGLYVVYVTLSFPMLVATVTLSTIFNSKNRKPTLDLKINTADLKTKDASHEQS